MSTPGKKAASFNRQRKAEYAKQANQGSRNQNAIEGPIVGRFAEVTETKPCRCVSEESGYEPDPECKRCFGDGTVEKLDARGFPVKKTVVVHDEGKQPAAAESATQPVPRRQRQQNARVEARRASAEARESARMMRDARGQLAELDARLGKGVGAVKERAQLRKKLAAA